MPENVLLLGNCLKLMKTLPAGSIDCVLTDLPYGTTDNKWDSVIPMDQLWAAWRRLLRPGAPVILFTQQPFTTTVAASNLKQLKTEWIWAKQQGTGFLNCKKYPMKSHENVLVFCDRLPPYWPQMCGGGASYKTNRKANCTTNYANTRAWSSANIDGSRYPITVLRPLKLNAIDRGLHPTQKPLALLEYLIRTYTQPGELILDNCAGSGTTLLAAYNTGRRFVGIERDQKYYWRARRRLAQALVAPPVAPAAA